MTDPTDTVRDNDIDNDPEDAPELPDDLEDVLPGIDGNPDQAWKALGLVNDWIKHAETKSGLALAAIGASGVLLFNLVKDRHLDAATRGFAAACVIFMVTGALCAVSAVTPRLSLSPRSLKNLGRKPDQQDLTSLLFFAHIALRYKGNAPGYVDVLRTLTADDDLLTRQVAQQVHANATVAHLKFKWSNFAVYALALDYSCLAVVAALVGRP